MELQQRFGSNCSIIYLNLLFGYPDVFGVATVRNYLLYDYYCLIYPLMHFQYQSTRKQAILQPEIKALREKYLLETGANTRNASSRNDRFI